MRIRNVDLIVCFLCNYPHRYINQNLLKALIIPQNHVLFLPFSFTSRCLAIGIAVSAAGF